jgi:sn-glycerol 3-phosphate transport system ATP-binding protein
VFQSYALFPHLSVRENILFGLKVRKEPARDYDRRLQRVAGLLGLNHLLDRKPSQLSGGQQQRVALGRAVISEAPVCLMDEPLSNLDAQLRHEMRREIRALQQDLGITMVYVTHDQTEAMSMADQVVLLRGGKIEQHDTPDGLYARPATEFAARFIGTPPMNLIGLSSAQGATIIAGTQSRAIAGAPAGAVKLGVRPEHIRIDANGVPATVESVEYFGADSIVVCRVGDTSGVAVRVGGHLPAGTGETLGLSWQDGQQHFFAADSAVINSAGR